MKKLIALFFILCLLAACNASPTSPSTDDLHQSEGIIAEKRETPDGSQQLLVIPDTDKNEISNVTDDEIVEIFQERDGTYYNVTQDLFDELEVGQRIAVSWDGSQADSLPPQRLAEEVEIISTNNE